MKNKWNYTFGFFLFFIGLSAQKTTEIDLSRAEALVWDSISTKVYNLTVYPQWMEDHSGLVYRFDSPNQKEYRRFDFKKQKVNSAFDHTKFAKAWSKLIQKEVSSNELNIQIQRWINPNQFEFSHEGKTYSVNLKHNKIEALLPKSKDKTISVSPDGQFEVFIQDFNLQLRNRKTGTTTPLSTDGSSLFVYGSDYEWDQIIKGEGNLPSPNLAVSWSPDSKKLMTQILDLRTAKKMYLLDYSIDSLYRPELLSYYRGSPGDTDLAYYRPIIYELATLKRTDIDLEPIPHFMDDLMNYGWKWSQDSQFIYGQLDHRGYKQKDFIEINPNNGKVRVLFADESKTNIDYLTRFQLVEEAKLAFLTSEKSGWKQLYRLDWQSGQLTALTQGEFVVKDIEAIDVQRRQIYFSASGKEKGVNPYFNLLYRIDFDGANLVLLTPEPLNHEISISPDFNYFLDNISSADHPTITVIRSSRDGKIISEISRADVSELEKLGWKAPMLFTALAQDGQTEIHGALWRPTDFDSTKKYPIVDYTYTGPHMNVYPNTFRKGVYGLYNSNQSLAELGFVVMQVDGMGSAGRSKDFHNVSYKNMGQNLKDHTLAIHQLGQKHSWIDTEKVGIFGHSAGGYDAAHALMAFNDTYIVAISEAADHDWRMEKAWWPEMYAGWPVDETYHLQSNVTMAPQMKGKLLLIHGAIDENVNPSATFKLSEALIKADKDFDLLILPSARHSFPKTILPYVQKKRWRYFLMHLK